MSTHRITGAAMVAGIAGNPVGHSLSPVIHNAWLTAGGIDGVTAAMDEQAQATGAILASNTSYLDIDEIASATSRPQDVLGLHFFSPANVMRLLEVVRGAKTAKDVLATVIGEVTEGDRLQITWHGETVVDVPPRTVAHDGPVYERPVARPDWQDTVIASTTEPLQRPSTPECGGAQPNPSPTIPSSTAACSPTSPAPRS